MKSVAKKGVLIATLLGVYSLFVFTTFEGIPFPLEMSILPTLFLALGLLSGMITVAMLAYASISIVVISDPLNIGYANIFYTKPRWLKSELSAGVINFSIFFVPPSLVLLTLAAYIPSIAATATICSIIIFPALFSYYALSSDSRIHLAVPTKAELFRFLRVFITFFYVAFLSVFSFYVFLKYIEFGFGELSNFLTVVAISLFAVFSFFVLVPAKRKDGFQRSAEIHHGADWKSDISDTPAFYAYCAAFCISLFPAAAHNTAMKSFQYLNIGGGIERSYYFSKRARIDLPEELIESCVGDVCYTKNLKVVMDLGGALYVKGEYFGSKRSVLALPGQHLFMVDLRVS